MKRIISLLLALTLVLSMLALVSCKGSNNDNDGNTVEALAGKTPRELYELSKEKLAATAKYSIISEQVITVSDVTVNQTVTRKLDGDNCYFETYNDTATDANMKIWYVDGIMYMDTSQGKSKCEYTKEQYMEDYMEEDPSESTLLDIPESWFVDVKFEKEGESWVLNLVISAAKYNELLANTNLGSTINGDVVYKVYFDTDGNMGKITTSFDMTVSGSDAHCDQVSFVTFDDFTVTAPDGAENYQLTAMP